MNVAHALDMSGVKGAVALAALLYAVGNAAAQNPAAPPSQRVTVQGGPSRPRTAPAPPPIAIPQELAPPQEVYAAFPQASATAAPAPPSDCDVRLGKIAVFRPLGVLIGAGECGAVDAVLLESVILPDQTKVAVAPPATLRCPMAEGVANWVRDDVAPAAIELGAPLRGIDNFDSYECRGRNRVQGATLSEHGRANALDVRSFRLANGENVVLTDVSVDKAWREAIRATVCARFSTVLGPGSDGAHEEHIHLDLAARRNNYKICEWDVREPVAQAPQPAPRPQDATAETQATAPLSPTEVPLPRPRPLAANATQSGSGTPARKSGRD
jgi:hypothetical protein